MKKYKYKLNNLDCANCANKIEVRLKKEENLKDIVLNFSNLTLTFKSEDDIKKDYISNIVKSIEPDVNILNLNENVDNKNYNLLRLIIGLIFALLSFVLTDYKILSEIMLIISYIILLYRTLKNAVKMFFKSKTINENALITISAVGAYLIDKKMEGLMVITLYEIGKILEEKAVNKSRKSISDLMDISQNYANKVNNEIIEKINVEDVKIGDILLVKKGEKIPVDGVIMKGNTSLDLSSLTGESESVMAKENDNVLSGSINLGEVINIKATKLYTDSTVSKILSLIEEASDKKSKTKNFVSKASKYYTPIVIILSIITFIVLILFTNLTMYESIYRALTFLVISCPCAIAISVPLSYFTAIGVSSKHGVLVKGSNYLDLLSSVNKIIFDKTGTLTNGSFKVEKFDILDDSFDKEYILDIYAKVESLSNHPIAKSIVSYVNKEISNNDVRNYKEVEGLGVCATIKKDEIKIGNANFFNNKLDNEKGKIYLSVNDKIISSIIISDGIKDNVKKSIYEFNKMNIDLYMFTGDSKENALSISNKLNIKNVFYSLLPNEKYEKLEKLLIDNNVVAFIGDGINDAPSLKRADIGISMGSIGSSSAIEASDIVIMDDDIGKIVKAINISKYTRMIIKQNLIFALTTKVLILILSAVGIANMWQAVFADVGVTIISILNTLRIMKR